MERRSYEQACALAWAADAVGERWSLLIVRDLLIRPRRYSELLRSLDGMGTNLLVARLKQMETDGLVIKQESRYALTERGAALEPAILALIRWGRAIPARAGAAHHQDDWDLLAFKALADCRRMGKSRVVVQLHCGRQPVRLRVRRQGVDWSFEAGDADIVVDGTLADLEAHLLRGKPLAIKGSRARWKVFLSTVAHL